MTQSKAPTSLKPGVAPSDSASPPVRSKVAGMNELCSLACRCCACIEGCKVAAAACRRSDLPKSPRLLLHPRCSLPTHVRPKHESQSHHQPKPPATLLNPARLSLSPTNSSTLFLQRKTLRRHTARQGACARATRGGAAFGARSAQLQSRQRSRPSAEAWP